MLRPEFVRAWPEPICPDCFTNFQRLDQNSSRNNGDLLRATRYLQTTLVLKFANRLEKRAGKYTMKVIADHSRNPEEYSSNFTQNRAEFTKQFAFINKKVL